MTEQDTDAMTPLPPPEPLNRDRVLQAALDLADAAGLEALSMRRLAQTLGVQAMSLYHHVANKEDILDAIADRVVSEIELPSPSEDWQQAMRRRAHSAHAVLLRHPWAALALLSRVNVGPAMLRYVEATLSCLYAAGFPLILADHAWNALDSHIYGFTLQELNFPLEAADYATAAANYEPLIPAAQYPTLNQLTQLVIAGDYDGLHDFEFGLNLLLDSLEARRQTPEC